MIDKKELRIGNVIRRMHHLPIGFKIPHLIYSAITEIAEGMVGITEGMYKYSDIASIPLTDDVLVKLGIKNISDTIYLVAKVGIADPDIYLLRDKDEYYLSTENGGRYSASIKSLHQLQNIYYALTGRDLTVEL